MKRDQDGNLTTNSGKVIIHKDQAATWRRVATSLTIGRTASFVSLAATYAVITAHAAPIIAQILPGLAINGALASFALAIGPWLPALVTGMLIFAGLRTAIAFVTNKRDRHRNRTNTAMFAASAAALTIGSTTTLGMVFPLLTITPFAMLASVPAAMAIAGVVGVITLINLINAPRGKNFADRALSLLGGLATILSLGLLAVNAGAIDPKTINDHSTNAPTSSNNDNGMWKWAEDMYKSLTTAAPTAAPSPEPATTPTDAATPTPAAAPPAAPTTVPADTTPATPAPAAAPDTGAGTTGGHAPTPADHPKGGDAPKAADPAPTTKADAAPAAQTQDGYTTVHQHDGTIVTSTTGTTADGQQVQVVVSAAPGDSVTGQVIAPDGTRVAVMQDGTASIGAVTDDGTKVVVNIGADGKVTSSYALDGSTSTTPATQEQIDAALAKAADLATVKVDGTMADGPDRAALTDKLPKSWFTPQPR